VIFFRAVKERCFTINSLKLEGTAKIIKERRLFVYFERWRVRGFRGKKLGLTLINP